MKETKKEEIELLKLKIRLLELEIEKMKLERGSITTTTPWYYTYCNGATSGISTVDGSQSVSTPTIGHMETTC